MDISIDTVEGLVRSPLHAITIVGQAAFTVAASATEGGKSGETTLQATGSNDAAFKSAAGTASSTAAVIGLTEVIVPKAINAIKGKVKTDVVKTSETPISNETSYAQSSGKLNWDKIVSKKGETRIEHINRHCIPNNTRETHGVFNGNAVDIVNQAWENRNTVEAISDGMGGSIYNIPFKNAGYESGYVNSNAKMDYVTIIIMEETDDLITTFPPFGKYHKYGE